MLNTDYPHAFNRFIAGSPAGEARYLELSKSGESFQLRALVANEWKTLDISPREARRIWSWATGRIQARLTPPGNGGEPGRSPAVEIVGRLAGNDRVKRLKLRWRARPAERAHNGGTLTMRMTDLVA